MKLKWEQVNTAYEIKYRTTDLVLGFVAVLWNSRNHNTANWNLELGNSEPIDNCIYTFIDPPEVPIEEAERFLFFYLNEQKLLMEKDLRVLPHKIQALNNFIKERNNA